MTKDCPHCAETLPIEAFGWRRSHKKGGGQTRRQSWCIECMREVNEIYGRGKDIRTYDDRLGLIALRRLWQDKRLREIYLEKRRGRVPEEFRLAPPMVVGVRGSHE